MVRLSSRRSLAALVALPLMALALTSCNKEGDKAADASKTAPVEAPKMASEAPKTEAPKTEVPTAEAPKMAAEAPKMAAEAPKTEAPATEAPKTAAAPATTAPAAPSTPAKPGVAAPAPDATVDMAKLLQPGTLPDMMIGKADAPVTIVEYASMTCPHCAHFSNVTLPLVKAKYIDAGKVRLIFREFPFDPRAEAGFMLARCSADKYFPMVDVLYHQQEEWAGVKDAKDALLKIARLAGFSQESFEKCLTDQKLLDDIRAVRDRAEKDFSVSATPTFFINGKQYAGALSIDEMSAIIDGLL